MVRSDPRKSFRRNFELTPKNRLCSKTVLQRSLGERSTWNIHEKPLCSCRSGEGGSGEMVEDGYFQETALDLNVPRGTSTKLTEILSSRSVPRETSCNST